ncbi:MAG: cation:H+ antiporter, partial [Chloroflexota bacterium]|nr:cation:H+ antiporter [Chloroflexota bacterium]
ILIALVLAPIATELPEKFNSLIWVRNGKDTLAMGNITGAMVFQSCIPTIIGILLAADAWSLAGASTETLISFASAGIAFVSTLLIFWPMVRRGTLSGGHLLIGGLFYVIFVGIVIARLIGVL